MPMSLSLAAGRQLVESFPFMTDWGQRGSASRADKSEACYAVDGDAGDDPGASVMPIAQPGSAH